MAPSAGVADEAEATLKQAEAELKTEAIGDGVIEAAQNHPQRRFVLLLASDPSARDKEYYRSLAHEGVDAVLEIAEPKIYLVGECGGNINPCLKPRITVRTTLIRTEDGTVLHSSPTLFVRSDPRVSRWNGHRRPQSFTERGDQHCPGVSREGRSRH